MTHEPLYDMVAGLEERMKNLDKNLDLYFSHVANIVNAWRLQLQNATQKTPGSLDWPSINRVLSSMEEFELSTKKQALKH